MTSTVKPSEPPAKPRRIDRRWLGRWVKRSALGLFILGGVAAVAYAFVPPPIAVDAVVVRRGTLEVTIDEEGRTRVKDRYTVSTPIGGSLGRLELAPGDRVTEGQVIARLVPMQRPLLDGSARAESEARVAAAVATRRQSRAAIERARAALELATRAADRQRRIAASGGSVAPAVLEQADLELRGRREELASAEFGARVATHQVEMARAALGRFDGAHDGEQFEVTAPVDGVVLRVAQPDAAVVAAGTPLLEIGDPSHLEIVVDVLTADAIRVEPGTRAIIERWGGDEPLDAHVRLVEPSAFSRVSALGVQERRVPVVLDLDTPHERWARLGDGYRVEVRLIVFRGEELLLAPASAVFRRGDGFAAFRVLDERAELRSVAIGQRSGLAVEIVSGLAEGDRLVAHPSDRVVEGARVAPR